MVRGMSEVRRRACKHLQTMAQSGQKVLECWLIRSDDEQSTIN
jgi:hypothetical protein